MGVRLEVQMPASDVTLVGDEGRLQQVLWNLLSNATKFTPARGRVRVLVSEQDSQVRIEVSDTGKGITSELLPYVFDRFRQADGQMGRSPTGLGLGLAVVRDLVQAHGGTIVAESPGDGQGSTFTVNLPVSFGIRHSGSVGETLAQLNDAARSLRDVDVLVVDDDGDARDLLGMMLDSRGATVRAVPSAAEAFEAIAHRRPNLLLADILMPDGDGYSLIRRVRERERELGGGRVPAIAVTANADASDRERAIAAGYDWHLAKPVDMDELLRVIAKFGKTQGV
jgi:CheY-like chemotaxis protein